MAAEKKKTSRKTAPAKSASKKTTRKPRSVVAKAAAPKKKTQKKTQKKAVAKVKAKAPIHTPKAAKKPAPKPKKEAKPAAPEKLEKPKKPKKPKKSSLSPELLKTIRDALVIQRQQLMSVMQSTQAQMAEKNTGLADMIDRASDGFEDELAIGLMRIEAAQIEDIEAAIARIDERTYGICVTCERAIPRKRMEVLPFALRCLNCEGTRERLARIQGKYTEEI